jgi:APA family basic amino acid/polyamine antiporter
VRPFRAPFGSVVPILGIITCLILMFSLAPENWWRLIIWLAVGMLIYFGYSRKHCITARLSAEGSTRR